MGKKEVHKFMYVLWPGDKSAMNCARDYKIIGKRNTFKQQELFYCSMDRCLGIVGEELKRRKYAGIPADSEQRTCFVLERPC